MSEAHPNHSADEVESQFLQKAQAESKLRTYVGASMLAIAAGGVAIGVAGGFDHVEFAKEMPFSAEAQGAINHIDDVLAAAGAIGLAGCAFTVGGVKVAARLSPRAATIDRWSSQEMTDDGRRKVSATRSFLRKTAAGSIPVVAIMGSALGGVMTGIGTEITNGPDRSLAAIDTIAPGEMFVTQSKQASPMMDQNLSNNFVENIVNQARVVGIRATPVSLNLSSYTADGKIRSDLLFATNQPDQSLLKFDGNCRQISVIVDKAANLEMGSKIEINNVPARVVGQTEGISALNRIGILADKDSVTQCIEKGSETSTDFVVLDTTDKKAASQILKTANFNNEASSIISKANYITNSEDFWRSNVKPITNFLALVSGGLAMVAVMGGVAERIQRNRREWARKFASGASDNAMRSTELVRSAKEGLVASVGGVVTSIAVMPVFNMMASGLRAGIGLKEMLVASAVGTIFPLAGAAVRTLHPRKTVNVTENTRG